MATTAMFTFVATLPANAGAATSQPLGAVTCKNGWAKAATPVLDNIVGNAYGLFIACAVLIGLLMLLFLGLGYWSRHRGTAIGIIGALIVVAIFIQIFPAFMATILPNGC
jgi:hypothetical protein